MKKLFQDPRKAAAVISAAVVCAALLIAGIVFAVTYAGKEDDLYLKNIKLTYGTSADVVYARDRLDFTEIELPRTVGEYTPDYENSFLADGNTVVAALCVDDKRVGAGVYYIREGIFKKLFVLTPSEDYPDHTAYPVYADGKYAVVLDVPNYNGVYSSQTYVDKLYVFDLQSLKCTAAYFAQYPSYKLETSHSYAVYDDMLFFDFYYYPESAYYLNFLDIASGGRLVHSLLEAGFGAELYNGGLVYDTGDGSYISLDGSDPFIRISDGGVPVIGRSSAFEFRQEESGEQTLTEVTSGKRIFSFETLEMLPGNKDHIGFAASVYDHQGFIYSMSDNEIMVFAQDERVIVPRWFECGLGLWLGENNGGKVSACVVSEKEYDVSNKYLAVPELPDGVTAFGDFETFISFVPIISLDEAMELVPVESYSDDEIYRGQNLYLWDKNYEPPVINGYVVKFSNGRGYFEFNGKRVRAVKLYRTYDNSSGEFGSAVEWGYYDPETRGYTSLFDCADYGDPEEISVTENYLCFSEVRGYADLVVEISSIGSPDGLNIIKIGEGLTDDSYNFVEGGGLLYFSAWSGENMPDNLWLYSFDPVSGELERLVQNVYPFHYAGERLFYTDGKRRYVSSLDGLTFDRYDIEAASAAGLFGVREEYINGAQYDVVYNMLTGESIFGVNALRSGYADAWGYLDTEKLLMINGQDIFGNGISLLYDHTNRRVISYDIPYRFSDEYAYLQTDSGISEIFKIVMK